MPTITCNNQEVDLVSVSKKITLDACPSCGADVTKTGPFLYCTNRDKCSGVHGKRLKKWVKKRNILHLGDSNLDILIGSGAVKIIPDFYDLTVESMIAAGMSEGMSKKIHKQIDNSRACPLAEMIGSMSLDMLGRSEAGNLVKHGIDTLDKWKTMTIKQIESFPGYSKDGSKATRIFNAVQENWSLILATSKKLMISVVSVPKTTGGKLSGKSFCFTGTMNKPRKELSAIAEAAGADVQSKARKGLSYLVIADPNSKSSKAKDARKNGIQLISEEEFLAMA